MDPKSLLVAHGEKILVVLLALLCGWWVYATITDEATIAKAPDGSPLTPLALDTVFRRIDQARQNPGVPNLHKPRDFVGSMQTRLAGDPAAGPVMAWIFDHPDLGDAKENDTEPVEGYAFEVGIPRLQVVDRIGQFELLFDAPKERRPNSKDDRIKDALKGASWSRHGKTMPAVENRAAIIGRYIERADGKDGEWKPLDASGVRNGLQLFSEHPVDKPILVDGIQDWKVYRFRASYVVAATTFGGVEPPSAGREVAVLARPLKDVAPNVALGTWGPLFERIKQNKGGEFQFARPYPGRQQPPLNAKERALVGLPSEVVERRAESTVRMALERASAGIPGIAPSATFIMKRQGKKDSQTLWSPTTTFKVEVGQQVGGRVELRNVPWAPPGVTLFPVDFTTPFTLKEVRAAQERIWYWEVSKGRNTETGEYELTIDKKTRSADVVVVESEGLVLEFVELHHIQPPRGDRHVYPQIPRDGGLDEKAMFEKQPIEFRAPELTPERPREVGKDVLEGLIPHQMLPLVHDKVVQMGDGRIVYYYTAGRGEVRVASLPNSEAARKAEQVQQSTPEVAPAGAAEAPVKP